MNRRTYIHIILGALGSALLSSCGSDDNRSTVRTLNELRSLRKRWVSNGQQFYALGHTIEGIGGGIFYADLHDRKTIDDDGSTIVSYDGVRFKRKQPTHPTAEMFGAAINIQDDQSIYINKCMRAYGACYLKGGSTYNIQHPIGAVILKTYGQGNAKLNLVSPTNNNRFGRSPYFDSAAVYCDGQIGSPLKGVYLENIDVFCNGLMNADVNVGVKGFILMRCVNFFQRNCSVFDSSYAFWDADTYNKPLSVFTYCSGRRENCLAIDSHVSFEQVNCKGVHLEKCTAMRTDKKLIYSVEALFHAYGGTDMQLTYKDCIGIADGQCSSILLFARECKNVLVDNCQFINNFDNGNHIQAAIYYEGNHADYNNMNYVNCVFKSKFSPAVVLHNGEYGSDFAEFEFKDCNIEGYQIGVQFNGVGGVYKFFNCNITAYASGDVVPWALYANANPSVSVKGGSATAVGDIVIGTTNLNNIYEDVLLSPQIKIATPTKPGTLKYSISDTASFLYH